MPTYRIVVQTNVSPEAQSRAVRSTDFSGVEHIDIKAPNLTDALLKLNIRNAGTEHAPRVVAAEELLDIDIDSFTDEVLERALKNSSSPIDLNEYEGLNLYPRSDFDSIVTDVASSLRDSGLVPSLHLSVLRDSDGVCDYTMIEIHDTASGTYRSVGRDSRRLIGDRSLTGRDGILSIARTLIETAAVEHLL